MKSVEQKFLKYSTAVVNIAAAFSPVAVFPHALHAPRPPRGYKTTLSDGLHRREEYNVPY